MAQQSILLKNGTALIHNADDHVVPTRTDILIEGGTITRIDKYIQTSTNVEVMDCTDKIISPGFIDTHHHGWQTQLKGRHADELFLNYMVTGAFSSLHYTAKDVFWGQLAGMLEALDAGTTTVVDHAHIIMSPDYSKLGIAAMASSGVRSVYCYAPTMRPKSLSPLQLHETLLEDWVMQTFSQLADQAPFGNGRVTLGFAYDLWFLPQDATQSVFEQVKEKNIRTITSHGHPWTNAIRSLSNTKMLDERFLISHGGIFTKEDAEIVKKTGAHISSTPSTEMQMSLGGRPICFDAAFSEGEGRYGIQERSSFGVDCHSNQSGSIISEARIGLQNARMQFHNILASKGKLARELPASLSVEAAFNLATIKGAEAVRMEGEIGRIAVGYRADLVVFDGMSPAMVCAAQHDPVAAIILHSSPSDVEIVMVDGILRKKNGALLPVNVDAMAQETVQETSLTWKEISKKMVVSRERIQKLTEGVNVAEGTAAVKKLWHVDESTFAN